MPFRIDTSGERVVIRDTPSGQWIFGSVFVSSGLIVLSIPFLSDAWSEFVLWQRMAVLAIGIGHLTIGAWYVWRHPQIITTLDRGTGEATSLVRHPFSRKPQSASFMVTDVRAIEIKQSVDSDGDPMFQLRLWLSGSRVLPLQSQPTHGGERAEQTAAELRTLLALPDSA